MLKHKSVVLMSSTLVTAGILAGLSAPAASAHAKKPALKPITIAVASPFSGMESFIGPDTLNGVDVAVTQINANGGVLGHKVQIVTADTVGDPVDAVPAVSQIIATAHPVAMIGPSSLTITSVIRQLNQDKLVDMTIGGTTQLDHMKYKYIYRVTPSDSQMGVAMAYYGTQIKHYKRAALLWGANASAQTLNNPVESTLKKHGVDVVSDMSIVPDQSSYRSEVERILAAKPDVIYTQLDPQSGSTFFSELQQLGGGNIPLIGDDVTASAQFAQAIGVSYAAKELVSVQPPASASGPAAADYARYYAHEFSGQQPIILSNNGYDAMNIIALAMIEAKSTNPTVYVKDIKNVANGPGVPVYNFKQAEAAIKAHKKINYQGASGPEDFNKFHNVMGAAEADGFTSSGTLFKVVGISPQDLFGY